MTQPERGPCFRCGKSTKGACWYRNGQTLWACIDCVDTKEFAAALSMWSDTEGPLLGARTPN